MTKPLFAFKAISKECYQRVSQANVKVDLISKKTLTPGRNPFKNIKIQVNGGLVASPDRLMVMAATLVAHSHFFKINNKPMIIPANGAAVDTAYYQQAINLLHERVTQLEDAYQHYLNLLKSVSSSRYTHSYLSNVNKAVQIQQYLAGALLLRKQYILLQSDSSRRLILTPAAAQRCMNACDDLAKLYLFDLVGEETRHLQLCSAANNGNIISLKLLLADPATDVNKHDIDNQSALLAAVEANQLRAVKLLVEHGATVSIDVPPQYSPLTISANRGFHDIGRYLQKHAIVSYEKSVKELPQGPSNKNRALKDVEYIFHCLLGLAYATTNEKDKIIYQSKTTEGGDTIGFKLIRERNGIFLAACPNGHIYNLSLALKHANLNYFILDESPHSLAIIQQCDALLMDRPLLVRPLKSESRYLGIERSEMPIYTSEEEAIRYYTNNNYFSEMNSFLRGLPNTISETAVKKIFVRCMLVMSGVNKNIAPRSEDEVMPPLFRRYGELPLSMDAKIKSKNRPFKQSGFSSFSKNCSIFRALKNVITIDSYNQCPIAQISHIPSEQETLLPPSTIMVTEYDTNERLGEHHFKAKVVTGVATEYSQSYLIDLALHFSRAHLRQPYSDTPDPRFGIARHNHALAHHVRACMLVEPAIKYFKQHAKSAEFRTFCDNLTPEELIITKVMMIYSKTGRESEMSATSDIDKYMSYQRASVEHFTNFLRNKMRCGEEDIANYAQILMYMGNPGFATIATGTPQEIDRKIFIHNIVDLAHKLDLPRVYTAKEFNRAMSPYSGAMLDGVVAPSVEQKSSLQKLESQAMTMLVRTGDRLMFPRHGIAAVNYDSIQFVKCNKDADYCWQCCEVACIEVEDNYCESRMQVFILKNAIDDNQRDEVTHYILHFQAEDHGKFEEYFGCTVLSALLNSEHDYKDIIKTCAIYMPIDQQNILNQYRKALEKQDYGLALVFADYLVAPDCIVEAIALILESFDMKIYVALLAKCDDEVRSMAIAGDILYQAIEANCSLDVIEMMVSAGVVPTSRDLLHAFGYGTDVDRISYLLEKLPQQQFNAEILIEAFSEIKPPCYAEMINRRLGNAYTIHDIILEHIEEMTSALFAKAVKYNPTASQRLIDSFIYLVKCEGGLSLSDFIIEGCNEDVLKQLIGKGIKCSSDDVNCAYNMRASSEIKQLAFESVDASSLPPVTVARIINAQSPDDKESMLKHLLDRGINVNYSANFSLLHLAVGQHYPFEMISMLLAQGALVSEEIMLLAIHQSSSLALLVELLSHITPAHLSTHLVTRIVTTYSGYDSFQLLDIILSKGYVLNTSPARNGLLHCAIAHDLSIHFIQLLIERGAIVNFEHLLCCDRYGVSEQVQQLIFKHVDQACFTPLGAFKKLLNVKNNFPMLIEVLSVLKSCGFDFNGHDADHRSILYHAIEHAFPLGAIRKIINSGAIFSYEEYSLFAKELPNKLCQAKWESLPPTLRLAYCQLDEAVSVLVNSPIQEIRVDLLAYYSRQDYGVVLLSVLFGEGVGYQYNEDQIIKVLQLVFEHLPESLIAQPLGVIGKKALEMAKEQGLDRVVASLYLWNVSDINSDESDMFEGSLKAGY